jgi:hypothetical protein
MRRTENPSTEGLSQTRWSSLGLDSPFDLMLLVVKQVAWFLHRLVKLGRDKLLDLCHDHVGVTGAWARGC